MSFEPRKGRLRIASYGETPLLLFKEEVLLNGELLLDQKKMTGKGVMFYKEAQLSARDFKFTNSDILSDNAAFALLNRF